jgi:hypothetical protein
LCSTDASTEHELFEQRCSDNLADTEILATLATRKSGQHRGKGHWGKVLNVLRIAHSSWLNAPFAEVRHKKFSAATNGKTLVYFGELCEISAAFATLFGSRWHTITPSSRAQAHLTLGFFFYPHKHEDYHCE